MKTISASLQDFLLNHTVFGRADLITLTLPNGSVLNIASGVNTDIIYQSTRYYCTKYGVWQRGSYQNEATFKISSGSMDLKALILETVLFPGTSTPFMQVVNTGVLSGAAVDIQVLYWPQGELYTAGISMGTMKLVSGQIGNVKNSGRSNITCEVFDMTYILNRQVPPFAIQSSCRHTLFDPGCAILLSNFISTNIALAADSTQLYLNLTIPSRSNSTGYVKGNLILVSNVIYFCSTAGTTAGSPPAFNSVRSANTTDGSAHWTSMNGGYPLGYALFTSGQNNGFKTSIKAQTVVSGVTQLQVIKPLYFPVATSDNLKLIPGCDKTLFTCENAYNNLIHFGGAPFVPNPEIAQ